MLARRLMTVLAGMPAPTLDLDFAGTGVVDPRVTFSRASGGALTNSAGQVAIAGTNVPRITHDPITGRRLGLLVEEAQTNLLLRSEEFDNVTAWSTLGASVAANVAVSPSGASTADKIVEDTSNGFHYTRQVVTVVSGTSYVVSCYAKADGRNWFVIGLIGLGVSGDVFFDLAGGTVGNVKAGVTASIQSVGSGWYRCIVIGAATATSLEVYTQCRTSNGGGAYIGNGTSGICVWGAEVKPGSQVSTYIPTTNAAATRAADVATITGTNFSSWYRQDEGTLLVEYIPLGVAATSYVFPLQVDDGTQNNRHLLVHSSDGTSGANRPRAFSAVGGGPVSDLYNTTQQAIGSFGRLALAYRVNDYSAVFSGVPIGTDFSALVPAVNTLRLGRDVASGSFCIIARIRYWPRRLPDSLLQSLTAP